MINKMKTKKNELSVLQSMSTDQMWLDELKKLADAYSKDIKDNYPQSVLTNTCTMPKQYTINNSKEYKNQINEPQKIQSKLSYIQAQDDNIDSSQWSESDLSSIEVIPKKSSTRKVNIVDSDIKKSSDVVMKDSTHRKVTQVKVNPITK